MPNLATSHIIETTRITDAVLQSQLLVAHRMVETYLGVKKPLSLIRATYSNIDARQPLVSIEDYPINQVNDVSDSLGNTHLFTNDDRYIWAPTTWSTPTIVVQYLGGIETQIYDAIFRQARVLADRQDTAPENTEFTLPSGGDLREQFAPQYRSGLASDVKQMVFPFQQSGF